MRAKIESVAKVIVILLAVVIGSLFLKDRFSAPDASQQLQLNPATNWPS